MKPNMGDVVIVTKIAQRETEHEYHKDEAGYGHTRIFRIAVAYPVAPTLAMVVGMRDVHVGEVVDDWDIRKLNTHCKYRMWLVRPGPMNREILVPGDGLILADKGGVRMFHSGLREGRLRGMVATPNGPGVMLPYKDSDCPKESEV